VAESPERNSFDELLALLQKHGLEWLAGDTVADIQMGKTRRRVLAKVPRAQTEYQEVVVVPAEFKDSGRRTEFLTSEPFSDRERLVRLIAAIENTVVESAAMEAIIFRTTERGVTFAAIGAEPPAEADVDASVVRTRTHEAAALRNLLTQVLADGGEQK
jgi:hypothetical protein